MRLLVAEVGSGRGGDLGGVAATPSTPSMSRTLVTHPLRQTGGHDPRGAHHIGQQRDAVSVGFPVRAKRLEAGDEHSRHSHSLPLESIG